MEACPKCTFALTPEATECPACGVILAKLKLVPPPLPVPARPNPYAPPEARIEGLPAPGLLPPAAAPVRDLITRTTLAALESMRPWIRFLTVCGFTVNTLALLAALGLLFFGMNKPELMTIAFIYFVAAGVGFAVLSPLNRSTAALARLASHGASDCLETFALEQATFWRRMGALCAAYLIIVVVLVVLAGLAGALSATPR
jgi:hypothetical protein